ncbi:MAG: alanine racemase [Proteobacteria bacterium]|nr:alanine racemase [Pseudomonadota bacterium]
MHLSSPLLQPQTRVQVDLGALAHNARSLKNLLPGDTLLMAVVKANAYGHGAVQTARTALKNGADFLAVGRISEAVELKQAGIQAPILLFGDILPDQIPYACAHDIRITLTSLETAKPIAAMAEKQKLALKVHIKVDTGMGRLGILHDQLLSPKTLDEAPWKSLDEILAIHSLKGLAIEGIYTHLANSDARDKAHAKDQLDRFKLLVKRLEEKGITPAICHAANSAATIDMPDSHLQMVRTGIALYGLWPSDETDHTRITLKPAMSILSKIIHLKSVPKGFAVSYGSTHLTKTATRIATIPIGYADGYSRQLSNQGQMLVRGIKASIVGRVCMDFTMIDVGHIPDCVLGDEVVVMGAQGNGKITADDIAATLGTINYEITASLTTRMPICYTSPGDR